MKEIVDFLIKAGDLKKIKRRGWILRGVKEPETIAAHTFRTAIMALVLSSGKKLNQEKIIKMSLIHDLCEVYAGDTTPYDSILPKDKKQHKKIFNSWRRLTKSQKESYYKKKYKKEKRGLDLLIKRLPLKIRKEIKNLWEEYEKGNSKEGRFVRQLDRMENLLQALEYWEKKKNFAIGPWWVQIEELIDDPTLFQVMEALDKRFHQNRK